MTRVRCLKCAGDWDASVQPVCPPCLTVKLVSDPNLLRAKHDPNNLPRSEGGFRSVVSFEFVQNPQAFIGHACASGTWFMNHESNHAGKPFLFHPGPYASFPGSGIPPHTPMPTHGLDGIKIPDPLDDPHVFADDPTRIKAGVLAGRFVPIGVCATPTCSNLSYPTEQKCVVCRAPALAVELPRGS